MVDEKYVIVELYSSLLESVDATSLEFELLPPSEYDSPYPYSSLITLETTSEIVLV